MLQLLVYNYWLDRSRQSLLKYSEYFSTPYAAFYLFTPDIGLLKKEQYNFSTPYAASYLFTLDIDILKKEQYNFSTRYASSHLFTFDLRKNRAGLIIRLTGNVPRARGIRGPERKW